VRNLGLKFITLDYGFNSNIESFIIIIIEQAAAAGKPGPGQGPA
jgi:hypothetical protein